MERVTRHMGSAWHRGVVVLIAAVLCGMLVACGAASQPAPRYTVRIVRVSGIANIPSFDQTFTQSDPVRQLYQQIMALPTVPSVIHSCPQNVGPTYTFTFSRDGRDILDATASGSGCQILRRANVGYQTTAAFWEQLTQVIGQPA